jgi:hypothetical protein
MARRYEPPIGPAPQYREVDRQTYDVIDAQPIRGEHGLRQGPRLAEEQLVERGKLLPSWHAGVSPDGQEQEYATVRARGRSSLAADGVASRGPVWSNDPAAMAGFVQGNHVGDYAATLSPPPFQPRAGANPGTLSPIGSLVLGERPGNVVNKIQAPENGGRGRSTAAAVFGSEDVR